MSKIRKWMTLVEAIAYQGDYYLHVSSGSNLPSILQHGLHQVGFGNYSGYETALQGIYVTNQANLIADHINARQIEEDYVLVVVVVATQAVVDEDALDGWLHKALDLVAAQQQMSVDDMVVEMTAEEIGQAMARPFRASLGRPIRQAGSDLNAFLTEFCQSWVDDRIIGGSSGADGDWWAMAKERILHTFPRLSHTLYGSHYSLRLPSPIGFSGETRIVAVIHVVDSTPTVVAGVVPQKAQSLLDAVLPSVDQSGSHDQEPRSELLQLAIRAHPERTQDEIAERVRSLTDQQVNELLPSYRTHQTS